MFALLENICNMLHNQYNIHLTLNMLLHYLEKLKLHMFFTSIAASRGKNQVYMQVL